MPDNVLIDQQMREAYEGVPGVWVNTPQGPVFLKHQEQVEIDYSQWVDDSSEDWA